MLVKCHMQKCLITWSFCCASPVSRYVVMSVVSRFFSSPVGIFHVAIFLAQTLVVSVGPDKSLMGEGSKICTLLNTLDQRSFNNVAAIVGNIVFQEAF